MNAKQSARTKTNRSAGFTVRELLTVLVIQVILFFLLGHPVSNHAAKIDGSVPTPKRIVEDEREAMIRGINELSDKELKDKISWIASRLGDVYYDPESNHA